MKVCLLNPPVSIESRYGKLSAAGSLLPPLNVALLAAVVRNAGHEVALLDAEALEWSVEETARRVLDIGPDVFGVTATTTSIVPACSVIETVKEQNHRITTCVGGVHVTVAAEQTMRRCPAIDICVIGEGEKSLLELCDVAGEKSDSLEHIMGIVFRRGDHLVRTAPRRRLTNRELDDLPWPAWDLLPDLATTYRPALHSFRCLPCTSLITSRGCPGKCTFCDRSVFGNKMRGFSADYVLGMIRYLVNQYGIREIIFHDDNFVTLRRRLVQLCQCLIEAGPHIVWSCTARVDMVNLEVLRLMAKAGCWQIAYGIESGSQKILDSLCKGIALQKIRDAIRWTREAGIEPRGYFMIGVPEETPESLQQTNDFLMELPFGDFQMSIFSPHPGTQLSEQLTANGEFTPDWERDGGWEVTYVPRGVTAEEIVASQKRAMQRFYFRPSVMFRYAKRMLGTPAVWGPLSKAAVQLLRYG